MRRPGSGLKLWFLMAAVAIVAVPCAAARIENAPGVGMTIVGACVSLLAYKRYSEAVALRRAGGTTLGRSQKAGILLVSTIIATVIIGLSDLAFLVGYYGFLKAADETVVMSHWTPYHDPGYMGTGFAIGVILALSVVSSLRRTFWPRDSSRMLRRWLRLWPVALTVFLGSLLVAEELRHRYSFCRMMADYHAGLEVQADDPKKAALHAWLKWWYEKAALRPWLPVHPDCVSPNL